MALTYLEAINKGYPGVQCSAIGDGSVYSSITWEAGSPMPTQAELDNWIAVLAFRNRFTQTEKITIDLSSIDNPAAAMSQRQLAASLRVMNADLATATYVDLMNPATIAGINALETYGIVAAGRSSQILSPIIQPYEVTDRF
jgi:hypothetical protein